MFKNPNQDYIRINNLPGSDKMNLYKLLTKMKADIPEAEKFVCRRYKEGAK